MKINKLFLLSAFVFFPLLSISATADHARVELENYYSEKIKTVYPDLSFSVKVQMENLPKVDLDLITNPVSISDETSLLPFDQIKKVSVSSSKELSLEILEVILQMPKNKIEIQKVDFSYLGANPILQGDSAWTSKTAFFILGCMGCLCFLGISWILKNSLQKLSKAIEDQAQQGAASALPILEKELTPARKNNSNLNFTQTNFAFSDFQLKSLISECYWTENDDVAAQLLRKYPRFEIYKELSFGKNYLDYLRSVEPSEDISFCNDVYFLDPSSVFFELSVKDTPRSWARCTSALRFEKMDLSAKETLNLQSEQPVEIKPSSARVLKTKIAVRLRSITEEKELLATLPAEQKLKLPSLYQLSILPKETQKEFLNMFTARELASLWIGPDDLLQKLEPLLTDRKRLLLKSLPKNLASRNSDAFKQILKLCEDQRNQTSSKDKRPLQEAA